MIPHVNIKSPVGDRAYTIVFDETDSMFHFLDQNGNEWSVRWRGFETIDDALKRLDEMEKRSLIYDYTVN